MHYRASVKKVKKKNTLATDTYLYTQLLQYAKGNRSATNTDFRVVFIVVRTEENRYYYSGKEMVIIQSLKQCPI